MVVEEDNSQRNSKDEEVEKETTKKEVGLMVDLTKHQSLFDQFCFWCITVYMNQ